MGMSLLGKHSEGANSAPLANPKAHTASLQPQILRGENLASFLKDEISPCNYPPPQGCMRREGTSEAAPEAVRQAVGGGC